MPDARCDARRCPCAGVVCPGPVLGRADRRGPVRLCVRDRVPGHEHHRLALGEAVAVVRLPVLRVAVGVLKFQDTLCPMQLAEHLLRVRHHIVVALPRQLGDPGGEHRDGLVGVSREAAWYSSTRWRTAGLGSFAALIP